MFNFGIAKRMIRSTVWLVLLSPLVSQAQNQPLVTAPPKAAEIANMILRADSYRLNYGARRSVAVVRFSQQGVLQKTRQYHVYQNTNDDVLVVFKSKAEVGQKMLMVGHNYWLVMPKSRRPIRITPMQKLLGDASVGDLSSIAWAQFYDAQWQATEQIENVSGVLVATQKLKLSANNTGVSYANISLWLEQNNHFPVKADLYLASGKLAKQVWFREGKVNGQTRVVAMEFSDKLQSGKHTVIEYQQITSMELEDKYYNPAFLARNALSGL